MRQVVSALIYLEGRGNRPEGRERFRKLLQSSGVRNACPAGSQRMQVHRL